VNKKKDKAMKKGVRGCDTYPHYAVLLSFGGKHVTVATNLVDESRAMITSYLRKEQRTTTTKRQVYPRRESHSWFPSRNNKTR
jgi:hypothetical protein